MFRYILPIILVGGESNRFGKNKVFVIIRELSFLDTSLHVLFDIGFINIYISGKCNGYLYIIDEVKNCGPISGFLSIFFSSFIKQFSHCLFLPVDVYCFDNIFIFSFIRFYNKRHSNFFYVFLLPVLLSISFATALLLFNFCLFLKNKIFSIKFFLLFVLFNYYNTKFFFKCYYLNLNIYYNFLLLFNYK